MKRAKKFVGLLFALTIIVGSFAGTAVHAANTSSDFSIIKGVLTKYSGSGGSVTIPNGVTGIGKGAFVGNTQLTDVSIPSGVTSIGNEAFAGCTGLTNVTIPSTVTSIGEYTFAVCTGLTNVKIPNSVTGIGSGAFQGCTGLIKLTIPSSVTSIGEYAFGGCEGLTDVTIPNTVASIELSAFQDCTGLVKLTLPTSITHISKFEFGGYTKLTDITIPSSVTKIDNSTFSGCGKLVNIHVDSENKDYCSVDGVLFDKGEHILLCYPSGREQGSYVIPNSVSLIESYAFNTGSKRIDIIIPRSVTQIGAFAFDGTSITIRGYKDTSIQDYAKRNNFMFQALDADPITSDVSPLISAATAANSENGTVKSLLLLFAGVFICAIIAIACVTIWKKKSNEGKKSAQTLPLQSLLSQTATDSNSDTELETETEPEIMEVICLQCGHSCVATTEICPTCGRKFTK